MLAAPGPGAADAALYDLGWGELLAAAPTLGAATAFAALGRTGSSAGILDDVLAVALGLEPSLSTCVVLPRPHRPTPPGRRAGDTSVDRRPRVGPHRHGRRPRSSPSRTGRRASSSSPSTPNTCAAPPSHGLDPGAAYRRVVVELGPDVHGLGRTSGGSARDPTQTSTPERTVEPWAAGVAAARVALAHQLIAASRWMLDAARTHALDREQFGRSVASFQAVRHKLAESLVAIEGAESVAGACTDDVDPLLAAVAKSLAGKAARTSATHAQQVLAGIGFTTDHEFHLWLKRTLVVDTVFGSASSIPTEIGYRTPRRRRRPAPAGVVALHPRRMTMAWHDRRGDTITTDDHARPVAHCLTEVELVDPDDPARWRAGTLGLAGGHVFGGQMIGQTAAIAARAYPDMARQVGRRRLPQGCPRHRRTRVPPDTAARGQRLRHVAGRLVAARARRPARRRLRGAGAVPSPRRRGRAPSGRTGQRQGVRTTPARSTSG